MSTCIIITTPYQAVNVTQILLMQPGWLQDSVDLFVCRGFRGWETLANGLSDLFPFRAIYTFEDWQRVGSGMLRQIECSLSALFPKKYMMSCTRPFNRKSMVDLCFRYDTIAMGWYNLFPLAMIAANPAAQIVMFDEGTGSYHNDGREIVSKRVRLYSFFGKQFPTCQPELLYLNYPEMADIRFRDIVEKINRDEIKQRAMHAQMFPQIDVTPYAHSNTVFFTRHSESKEELKLELKTLCLVSGLSRTICRVHPWDTDVQKLPGVEYDYGSIPWEVLCQDGISDGHCLVGRFSTAMFTPKLLYGQEPYLFFTYPIFSDYEGEEQSQSQVSLVEMLMSIYSEPSRITLVNSFDELKLALQMHMK